MDSFDLLILGGGPGGLTAAIYGARAGLKTVILEQGAPGGQIRLTDALENWPGLLRTSGFELADNFQQHAESLGVEIVYDTALSLSLEGDFKLVKTTKSEYKTKALVVATGARFRNLKVPGEAEFTGRGVSYCAVCDGPFFKGETVAVVGGGNTAVQEANYLTSFADTVYLIHRRDQLRADQAVARKALDNPKIVPIWNSQVTEILGVPSGVNQIKVKNVQTNEEKALDLTGVFIFVGTRPNIDFVGDFLEKTPQGWLKTDEHLQTSAPGVFAAGDVRDTDLRQVVTACADGARAAMNAYHYIENL